MEYPDAIGQLLHIDSIIVKCGPKKRKGINLYRVVNFSNKKVIAARLSKDEKKNLTSRMSLDGTQEIQCTLETDAVVNVTKNLIDSGYTFSKAYYSN